MIAKDNSDPNKVIEQFLINQKKRCKKLKTKLEDKKNTKKNGELKQ